MDSPHPVYAIGPMLAAVLVFSTAEAASAKKNRCIFVADGFRFLMNGAERKEYRNGRQKLSNGVYVGGLHKNRRCGRGSYYFTDGSIFTGKWDGTLVDGIKIHANGTIRYGDFNQNGKHTGGTIIYRDGSVYQGQFVNGQYSGKAKLLYRSGTLYYGYFSSGKRNGHGIKCGAKNAYVYVGGFVRGEFHGEAIVKHSTGSAWEGVWNKGKLVFGVGRHGGKSSVFYRENGGTRSERLQRWCKRNGYRTQKSCIKEVSRRAALDKYDRPTYPRNFAGCTKHRTELQRVRKNLLTHAAKEKTRRP